jgi:molybdopterin-guanine dinucleotide biosynthesis protein A/HD superfamily phosphodiesterase
MGGTMKPALQKIESACLILAGGQGKRLTPDKPLLAIDGRPIIERAAEVVRPLFKEVLLVTNTPEKYAFLDLPHAADERPGCGPLMGIYSGLKRIRHEAAFVCAADMPFLNQDIIRSEFLELGVFDIVVPYPKGMPEFLHAFYRKRCLPMIRENLSAGLFKIEALTRRCRTRRLPRAWFERHGWTGRIDLAFANINTAGDYERWAGRAGEEVREEREACSIPPAAPAGRGALASLAPDVLEAIRQTLIEQESAYQRVSAGEETASLWAHSSRVGRIASHIAAKEGLDTEPALLAGLLHDTGKFADGTYHEDDVAEEETAARCAERVLAGTAYEKWIPTIRRAILSLYREEEATNDIGRVLYDADRLDKLGCMGVAQFFAKNALRRHFLDDDMMIRTSIELTYAHHAPDTLKTASGMALARERSARTRRFYTGLLGEWRRLGLGRFDILEEDIEGITCILVLPHRCPCGSRLQIESDIREAVKCRSAVVRYLCGRCGLEKEFSFCLPNVKGLPRKREPP